MNRLKNHKVYKLFLDPIGETLARGIVPVIYGDMIIDVILGCMAFSSEKVLGILALKFGPQFDRVKIINCTGTDGVYDKSGNTIPVINTNNFETFKHFIGPSDQIDVTGGMVHKVMESLKLAQKIDAEIYVLNGLSRGKFTRISKHVGVDSDNFKP